MDGAIILSPDADRIARANVHLMPNASIPTIETGTRHRTAERVARSIDVPVVSVSAAMGLVTVYRRDTRHVLQDERRLHERVRQALQTTRRFRQRFDTALAALSALEIADTVTVRDVVRRAPTRRAAVTGSPTRSRSTWWSWARTGGCCGCSSRRCSTASSPCAAWWCATTCAPVTTPVAPDAARDAARDVTPDAAQAGRVERRGVSNGEATTPRPRWRPVHRRPARRAARGRRPRAEPRAVRPRRPGRAPRVSGCCTGCRDFPTCSWTGSSSTSPACSGSCGPRWPISRRSKAWARPAPGR